LTDYFPILLLAEDMASTYNSSAKGVVISPASPRPGCKPMALKLIDYKRRHPALHKNGLLKDV